MRIEPQPRAGWVGPAMVGLIAAAIGVLAWLSLRPAQKPEDEGDESGQRNEAEPSREQDPDGAPPNRPALGPDVPILSAVPTLAQSGPGGPLEVRVMREDGTPVAGADVRLGQSYSSMGLVSGSAHVTDAAGVARFDQTPSAPCYAWAVAEGYESTIAKVSEGPTTDIRLCDGESCDLDVVEAFRVPSADPANPAPTFVEEPVAGAALIVSYASGNTPFVDEGRTDAAGRFRFRGFRASAPPNRSTGFVISFVGSQRFAGMGTWFAVPNPVVGPVKVSILGGGSVNGRVLDPSGNPVVNAIVRALLQDPTAAPAGGPPDLRKVLASSAKAIEVAMSDGDGRFMLRRLRVGEELVLVAVPSNFGTRESQTLAGGISAPFHFTRDARDATLDVTLTRGGSLAVTIVTETGEALTEAEVTGDQGVRRPDTNRADESGVFRLAGLFPGACTIRAKSRLFHETAVSADVVEGVETPVRVNVKMGTRVRGLVVDVGGTPVPRASVEVLGPDGGPEGAMRVVGSISTDAEGRFDIPLLPAGRLFVRATAEGAATIGDGVEVAGSTDALRVPVARLGRARIALSTDDRKPLPAEVEITHGPVDASRPAVTESLEVRDGTIVVDGLDGEAEQLVIDVPGYAPIVRDMKAAPGTIVDLGKAVLHRGRRLEGIVVDASGRGVASAQVVAAGGRSTTITDASGRFAIPGLPDGEVDVTVTVDGFLPVVAKTTVGGTGPPLRVALSRSAVLAGVVHDAEGKPAFAVRLVVTALDAGRDAPASTPSAKPSTHALRTDEDGTFRLDLPPGRYRVEAREAGKDAPGDGSVLGDVTLTEGEAAPITFVLPR